MGPSGSRFSARRCSGSKPPFCAISFTSASIWARRHPLCRPAQPNPWRRTQQQRLRRGDVQKVIAALEEHLEPVGTLEEEAPVRNGHRYLSNRQDCLDYPRALALGLPIGSGMIESGHRHVLQARLKKAGTAWLHDHADQIAHLRVLRANRQWQSLWN